MYESGRRKNVSDFGLCKGFKNKWSFLSSMFMPKYTIQIKCYFSIGKGSS